MAGLEAGEGVQLPTVASPEIASPGAAEQHATDATPGPPTAGEQNQRPSLEDRLTKVEERVTKLGPLRLSGDFRLRLDGILRAATKLLTRRFSTHKTFGCDTVFV